MAENNNMTQPNHTYNEVLRAINKLSEEDKEFILKQISIHNLLQIVDSQKSMDEYCGALDIYAQAYVWLHKVVQMVYTNMNAPDNKDEDIVSDYNKLNADQKKAVTLALLNNSDFQKDCCNILVKDFERIARENPTVKALDTLLGFSKHYKKCIELGIGCDHKYEV